MLLEVKTQCPVRQKKGTHDFPLQNPPCSINLRYMKDVQKELVVGDRRYTIYSLQMAQSVGLDKIERLPRSLKVLLENLLRHQNGVSVTPEHLEAFNEWIGWGGKGRADIAFHPGRVVMQDFTGVPALVDLAAMRDAVKVLGGDPGVVNPLNRVDLVIDHSVQVEHFGNREAFEKNVDVEYRRNRERYQFLKWGQKSFQNFNVVPPGTGIVHQINLEYLADVVWTGEKRERGTLAYPDTCVGTDSHTTMINGLSVLGWGVGGIEAEAAMLGRPITMRIPEVVGVRLSGRLREGITATDLVLNVVEKLRKEGVVGKFVEFFGSGLGELSLADRATLANMAPEYGATCGFFPIDEKTIEYLLFSGRSQESVDLVAAYAREQGLWHEGLEPVFSSTVELDMDRIGACISGPKRPQDKIPLENASGMFQESGGKEYGYPADFTDYEYPVEGESYGLKNGHVVVAAITSCTNTSNPGVLIGAGLVAKKARERGMKTSPWVKTSLAPGSQVVTDYLVESGLQEHLDALGFHLVGYGCTTCIGNTGPLPKAISRCINENNLLVTSVLSGNRNFEGRISPDVKANYLASPPLVVIYALAGNMGIDVAKDPIGLDGNGKEVYLSELWPTREEIEGVVQKHLTSEMYKKRYADVFKGDWRWRDIEVGTGELFQWDAQSTYVRKPTFFQNIANKKQQSFHVESARILAMLGDSVTTDHISPAGSIPEKSPAAEYLVKKGVERADWNSFGSRRGNHEVMIRGTFGNIRLKNLMLSGVEGGYTRHHPSGDQVSIYEAAQRYQRENVPLVVIAGKEYGSGSSRDWAAKGTHLLGVVAVIAESFERIHRSNLIGMGVLPLEFVENNPREQLDGSEILSIKPVGDDKPGASFELTVDNQKGFVKNYLLKSRLDTLDEMNYYLDGGILQHVLYKMNEKA